MKKLYVCHILIFVISFSFFSINKMVSTSAIDVNPIFYEVGVSVGDTITFQYNYIESLQPDGSYEKDFLFWVSVGGLLKPMTVQMSDKFMLKITAIDPLYIQYNQTYFLQNGSKITVDPLYVYRDDLFIDRTLITTNTSLIKEVMDQISIDEYYLDSDFYFRNTSSIGSREFEIETWYDAYTGWLECFDYRIYNVTHTFLEYELSEWHEPPPDPYVNIPVNHSYYTVNIPVGETKTLEIVKYFLDEGSHIKPGMFVNTTVNYINVEEIGYTQFIYDPNGTIVSTYESTHSRSTISLPGGFFMTTNLTLINEVFPDTLWQVTILDDIIQFELELPYPTSDMKTFYHFTYDIESGWLIYYHSKEYNPDTSEVRYEILLEVVKEVPGTTITSSSYETLSTLEETSAIEETSEEDEDTVPTITPSSGVFIVLGLCTLGITIRRRLKA